MSNVNNLAMINLLRNISKVNSNNTSTVSSTSNQNTELFGNILNSVLSSSIGGSSCSCNSAGSQLSTLTTIMELVNSVKINNQSTTNSTVSIESSTTSDTESTSVSTNNSVTTNNNIETSSKMDKALKLLEAQLGKPYVWGGNGPSSFDCSGLTSYIYKEALGKNIPRTSYDQSNYGQAVDKENLQPGDLVFFDTMNKGRVSHVGIYIGNDEFIHASNKRDGVKKSTLSSAYYEKTYRGARRP